MTDLVLYEQRGPISLITMNRPEAANAQNKAITYALDDAFKRFAGDDDAHVAILRGAGKHFSAGHDISGDATLQAHFPPVTLWWDHVGKEYAEYVMAYEEEAYLGMARRWRELPKPTIAAVHGACIGGALALAWACDLIVASEDAFFSDPVVTMGCPGIEFFCHPWVMGPRRAKEFLFTGERMTAQRAYEVGMINRIVPRDELEDAAMALAVATGVARGGASVELHAVAGMQHVWPMLFPDLPETAAAIDAIGRFVRRVTLAG